MGSGKGGDLQGQSINVGVGYCLAGIRDDIDVYD